MNIALKEHFEESLALISKQAGFRNLMSAKNNRLSEKIDEVGVMVRYVLIETALKKAYGTIKPSITVKCPAWRADKISDVFPNTYQDLRCGRSAFVTKRNGRKAKEVFCPCCGYYGPVFSIIKRKM